MDAPATRPLPPIDMGVLDIVTAGAFAANVWPAMTIPLLPGRICTGCLAAVMAAADGEVTGKRIVHGSATTP